MTQIAVIRLVGRVDINPKARTTFELLRLNRVHNCIVQDSSYLKGMLKHIKDFTTFGEIDEKTFIELFKERARKASNQKLDETDFKELKVKNSEELAKQVYTGKIKISDTKINPVFRLSPPRKGFERRSRKTFSEGGRIGNRGTEINKLLMRMI